ncbi:hypothetical protein Brsp04_02022 [Brucella sp. NBRC 12952]|uniref:Uncharacterized protein n=1 Tax=Brucella pseudogrignonensis TaxID=419475 RepID=A0A256GHC1_9HYPH|nr:hypothetical protein [Brucella pseudogrignonensis]MBK0022066.1 hypothetical protein [Ochrobactrum sp. S45]MBK0044080.1 hypothetical protein [Ochrobactrum sp. S46]OYR26522.1 hypothetical protein CEV34_2262 [Brucella pseudogrignonensis]UKK95053.1 hypothetical protein L7D45_14995 [Brucella pseudogrignonensis]
MKPDTVVTAVLAMCLLFLTWAIAQRAFDEMAHLQNGASGLDLPAASIQHPTADKSRIN